MADIFRVIDTGVRSGRANIAFDQALIEAHKVGLVPDTVRFLRFPPTALIGRHQALSRELDLDYCARNDIGVARRITGGGAIFFDENQLGWELVLKRSTLPTPSLADLTAAICTAAAAGISRLGADARYRPRNDIEVDGRKICGTGGFFDGDTLFFQGTLLIDADPKTMFSALNVPQAKLIKRNLDDPSARLVTLHEILGGDVPDLATIQAAMLRGFEDELGISTAWGEITEAEEAKARCVHDEEIGTDAFVAEIDDPEADAPVLSASRTGPGGTVAAYIRLEGPNRDRAREVLLTGDFFVTPPRTIYDLESSLRGLPVDDLGAAVDEFFARSEVDLLTVTPADFRSVIETALARD